MNSSLELHDSKVQVIEVDAGLLRIVFSSAYVHRSAGRPGIDAGAGYMQAAELAFSGATWVGVPEQCSGSISDGSVLVAGQSLSLIPLPFSASGNISAEIVFVSGVVLSVSATSVVCSCFGEPRFVENYVAG